MMRAFPRKALARALVDSLLGEGLTDGANGVFLAGPRRTGKTTFLRTDLIPELEARGVVVVYADLWANQAADADTLIRAAIVAAIQKDAGVLGKLLALLPKGVSVAGTGFTRAEAPDWSKVTLPELLQALQASSGRRVAVIVDEAQQALKSEAGGAAMFALKSARDTMNTPGDPQLLLVMTGSDRDKLLRLVHGHSAPFYGSQVHPMPPLGQDFIAFVAEQLEADGHGPLDRSTLLAAFEAMGHRPQALVQAISTALNPLESGSGPLEGRLIAAARARRDEDMAGMVAIYLALGPIDQVVLWRLLERREKFKPYDAEALTFYGEQLGASVSAAMAQNALERLRTKEPPVLWKSQRGEYALEDAAMQDWFGERVAAGQWPPT